LSASRAERVAASQRLQPNGELSSSRGRAASKAAVRTLCPRRKPGVKAGAKRPTTVNRMIDKAVLDRLDRRMRLPCAQGGLLVVLATSIACTTTSTTYVTPRCRVISTRPTVDVVHVWKSSNEGSSILEWKDGHSWRPFPNWTRALPLKEGAAALLTLDAVSFEGESVGEGSLVLPDGGPPLRLPCKGHYEANAEGTTVFCLATVANESPQPRVRVTAFDLGGQVELQSQGTIPRAPPEWSNDLRRVVLPGSFSGGPLVAIEVNWLAKKEEPELHHLLRLEHDGALTLVASQVGDFPLGVPWESVVPGFRPFMTEPKR
jgi:hypothetical protein